MAFFGDFFENIGEAILPRGSRGAVLGGALGGPVGAVLGAGTSQALAQASGQSAVSTPTATQASGFAPENKLSSMNGYTRPYQSAFTAGLPGAIGTAIGTTIGTGIGSAMDFFPDIDIQVPNFFGGSNLATCGPGQKQLFSVRTNCNGQQCISVSRKQQHQLKQMVMFMGIQETANYINLAVPELASLLVKKFPPRRRGISGSQLRNAKRVNRTIMGMAKQLQDACKTTKRR